MSVREEALRYLRMGWSVIPLYLPGDRLPKDRGIALGKEPRGPWAEFSNRLMQPIEVQSEFSEKCNVGIVTGRISGIVVVDIDPARGGSTDRVLERWPTGRISKTGGGGAHLYYRYPRTGHVGNFVDVLPGVDIRGDGGQVVAPPSTHKSGARYVWVQEGPLAEFPAELSRREKGTSTQATGKEGWAVALLESGAEEGSRDDSTARLAGILARHGLPEEIATRLLRSWNDARNKSPLAVEDIDKTVRSVYRTDSRRRVTEGTSEGLRLVPFEEFMSENMKEDQEWLVEGWLPDHTILFVVAAPESWKTWITFDLAMSIATGRKFLQKYEPVRKGPVILIQQEDFGGQTAQRLSVIAYGDDLLHAPTWDGTALSVPPMEPIPILLHPDRRLRFDDPESMSALRQAVEAVKPVLVVIDPLYAAAGETTEGFMATLPEKMGILKEMRDQYGTSFVIVHHAKKGADDSGRERLWGSQLLNAFMEAGWQLRPHGVRGSGKVAVSRHFKSAPSQPDVELTFDVNTTDQGYRYAVTEKPLGPAEPTEAGASKEDKILELAGRAGGTTIAEVATVLGVHRSNAFRAVKGMIKAGTLEYTDEKKTKVKAVDEALTGM